MEYVSTLWERTRALGAGDDTLVAAVGLPSERRRRAVAPARPHDLLVTRGWMMVLPRGREGFEGMANNALGLAQFRGLIRDSALDRERGRRRAAARVRRRATP